MGFQGIWMVIAHPGTSWTGCETIAVSQIDESHTVSSSCVMMANGSSAFGVKVHGFFAEVLTATSMRTGCCASCGLAMDGVMVTSRVLHAAVPAGSVTRVVVPGGGVGFGVAGAGVLALGPGVGGSAVTVAVLVGLASSSPDGHTWTTTQATKIAAAKRSSHRRTYTERGCCLLTAPR